MLPQRRCSLALCLPAALAMVASAALAGAGAMLEQVRIGLTQANTRIVFDLNSEPDFELLRQESPSRLVVQFNSTALAGELAQLNWSGTPVAAAHAELTEEGLLFILSLERDVEVRSLVMPPNAGRGHRLVLDLTDVSPPGTQAVSSLRIGQHLDFTRFVFDVNSAVVYDLDYVPGSTELVLEFPGTRLEPGLLNVPLGGAPVSSMQLQDESKLVFSLTAAIQPRVFDLMPHGDHGYRVVLDLYAPAGSARSPAAAVVAPRSTGPADLADAAVAGGGPEQPPNRSQAVSASKSKGRPVDQGRRARARRTTDIELSGTWQQEYAMARHGGNQKFESVIQPRLELDFANGVDLTAIARLRLDTVGDLGPSVYRPFNYSAVNGPSYNTENASLELREFYLDMDLGSSFLRLGKQQVVWGEADGIKVLDVVNPQSFRESILPSFDDSRIPLWMVNLELPVGREGSLQLLWIPDTTYFELAEEGTPYALTSPLLVPRRPPRDIAFEIIEPDKPDDPLGDSDAGVRYRSFVGGWDVSLNYLYSYADFPVPFQRLEESDTGLRAVLDPAYKRNHLVGGTANNAFGQLSLRTELAWSSDRWFTSTDLARRGVEKSDVIYSVLGLDWQHSSSGLLSAQWFYSRVLDYGDAMERDKTEQLISLLLQQSFANDSWEFSTLALHSLDYDDSMFQLKLKYWWSSALEVWVGADLFEGDDFGLFGQFDRTDRVLLGLQYGF